MSVTIKQVAGAPVLHVTGDVGGFFDLDAAVGGHYRVELSDGTQLKGWVDRGLDIVAGASAASKDGKVTVFSAVDRLVLSFPSSGQPDQIVTKDETARNRAAAMTGVKEREYHEFMSAGLTPPAS